MAETELLTVIEEKLIGVGRVLGAIAGTQVVGGGRSSCALALVERERTSHSKHDILIYSSETSDLQLSDLACDQVLPVDSDFVCDFGQTANDGNDFRVQLTDSGGVTVVLELPADGKTEEFISKIYSVVENSSSKEKTSSTWTAGPPSLMTETFMNSSEMILQRQNIAKGGPYSLHAREKMIKHYMDNKSKEYTYTKSIKVLVATWNVNGKGATVSLIDWLTLDPDPPDMYAIGFQELDLSKEAFIFNETPREGEWLDAVTNALSTRKTPYKKVCLVRLVGMMLIVFVKESHLEHVRNVSSETVGTGIMGKMGNKGGVGVRLEFHSTSICFVNSHLAAHVEEFYRRNQDYNDITTRMIFTTPADRYPIKDHDQIYWLGDLNYRVTNLDVRDVKIMLQKNDFKPILECDQLIQQKKLRRVFEGYTEGAINFQPTYKYDTGTDNWDSSEKNRAPAWCDRILWKGEGIRQINYRSHPSLRISDHKPVTSLFESQIRIIDDIRQRRVHEEVIKCLDKLENEFLPQVMVDTNEIMFGTVYYLEPISQVLIIANTGQVPAQFYFINKLDDVTFCKSWLHIEPSEGMIPPGDTCNVKLEVYIDKLTACKFNSGDDKLYDILVLHLEGGKDIFITVTGTYERSCFGSSIEALVHITVPIREIPVGKLIQLENMKEIPPGPDPYPIPKEIWFLVDHLYRYGLKQQLFVQPGLHFEIIQIRNWLDNGSSDPLPGSVFSMAEALLLLLESTAEPVIPYNLLHVCTNSASSYLQCKQIVQSLPAHRRNVFLYLCVFLQELLANSAENDLEAKVLATLFGRIFLRDPPASRKADGKDQTELDKKKANFVYHFLVNDQTDFILGR